MTRRESHRTAGFTLLEVLIAFAVASISLAVIFNASLESLAGVAVASRYEQAVSRARSHLDSVGANLAVRDVSGDDGSGFRWRERVRVIETSRLRQDGAPGAAAGGVTVVTLYAITVHIMWREAGATREVRLDSTRLGSATEAAVPGILPEVEDAQIPEN